MRLWPVLLLAFVSLSGCVELQQAARRAEQLAQPNHQQLDEKTVADGLKEALRVGAERAVASTSKVDGFLANAAIRIALPPQFKDMAKTMRKVGLGRYVDELEVAMNRAAEQAAGEAKGVLWQAVRGMSVADAWGILRGGDHAATDYFRAHTSAELTHRFTPIVKAKMAKVGLYRVYKSALKAYQKIPFVEAPKVDLDQYVTAKALDGLFSVLAGEEARIRRDPVARTTELLKKVFSEQ